MVSKILFVFIVVVFPTNVSKFQTKADDILGYWLTAGKEPAKILIYKNGEKYYGKIVWLKNPNDNGKPKLDNNNPDMSKRNNPIVGLLLLTGFKFNGEDEWKGGVIYDPESGKSYDSYLYLKGKNILRVRGYIGVSLLGRTESWTRAN